ncbi:MAG: TraB/GumN family protein [Desulfobacterales bacterium]|nr:TraB/GumN family protein [Desulfobacterales bacterium]
MTPADISAVLEKATVPEHSAAFMRAMSGGEPFLAGPYLFIAAEEWLLAVGYPLEGTAGPDSFEEALDEALRRTRARDCWAIGAALPDRLKPHRREQDTYYVLAADTPVPPRLERLAARAAATLTLEEGIAFTPAHRRLWAEFMGRVALPPRVRELYARTEAVLQTAPGLSLLNAWDKDGHLAACLLLDAAPRRFTSYLLGAHSRTHCTPWASDLLFREMLGRARASGKAYLHLGLGVNEGIRRFKTKWGGRPGLPYEMAEWQERRGRHAEVDALMRVLASMPREPLSKQQFLASLPPQRNFAMLWEVEKNGNRSWIGGTAHFFCYSFESSFRKLFERVDTVLFEGPLDSESLNQVSAAGRTPAPGSPRLIDELSEADIRRLERVVCGPRGFWARFFGRERKAPPDVRHLLAHTRHWMAFFSLWTGFLARQGWTQSVDLEAWHLALEMGKAVRGMESIAEQIETLEGISRTRVVNFLRQCGQWKRFIRRNVRAYLKGDVDNLFGTSIEFPTRTELVIHRRDARFLERMGPFLEAGRSAVFVGSAHMINLRGMLAEAGFRIRRSR